jgi:hypothetical protein
MSLGFNTMRNPRMTNLPGSVGGSIIVAIPQRRTKAVRSTNSIRSNKTLPFPQRDETTDVGKKKVIPVDETQHHGVYATVNTNLLEVSSLDEIFQDNARVYMVYPMRTEANEKVSMRVKIVNSVTGQLSYKWVIAFDPSTDERFLRDFSLIP